MIVRPETPVSFWSINLIMSLLYHICPCGPTLDTSVSAPQHSRRSYQPCEGGQNMVGMVWNPYWERKIFLEIQLIYLSSVVCQGPPRLQECLGRQVIFKQALPYLEPKLRFCYLGKTRMDGKRPVLSPEGLHSSWHTVSFPRLVAILLLLSLLLHWI